MFRFSRTIVYSYEVARTAQNEKEEKPMKKKTASIVSVLLLAVCLLSIPAQAAVPPTVSPCFEDIRTFYSTIDIDDSGKATAYSYIFTSTSSNTVYLTVYLQKLSGNTWSTLTSGSSSGSPYTSKSVSRYVTSGYYYRAKGVASVYNSSGAFVESATLYSNSKYY